MSTPGTAADRGPRYGRRLLGLLATATWLAAGVAVILVTVSLILMSTVGKARPIRT